MTADSVERPRGSLVDKLRWPIVIATAASLLTVGYVLLYISGQFERTEVFRVQRRTADGVALSISTFIQGAINDLSLFSQTLSVMELSHSEQQLAIERLRAQQQTVFEEIALLDRNGNEIAMDFRPHPYRSSELDNRSDEDGFQRALAGEQFLSDEVDVSSYTNEPITTIAVPIRNPTSDEVVGVLMAEVSLRPVGDAVTDLEVGETGYAYVVNESGRILAHSSLTRYLLAQVENVSDTPAMRRIQENVQAGESAEEYLYTGTEEEARTPTAWWLLFPPRPWEYLGLEGTEVVGTYSAIEGTRWFAVVELPTAEAYAGLRRVALTVIGLTVLACVVIGGLTSWLPRRIVKPLAILEEGAARLSGGQLEHRIQLRTGDELESLGRAFNEMASRLQALYAGLEQQVADRTADLARRSTQLEASAQVARQAAGIRDVRRLLDQTVHLISEQFGFYHAGIFLIDEAGEYSVLRAASSEGGLRMLSRGHRLRVGQVGIVGYVANSGEPRIALDVGEDAYFFDNPDLPETRSEMGLPLTVRDRVIGVLDVQSTEPNAFSDEDLAVLHAMADQVALAIDNARLLETAEEQVREMDSLLGRYSREKWEQLVAERPGWGYVYDGTEVRARETASTAPADTQLRLPLRVRDQVVGRLGLVMPTGALTREQRALAETVVDQASLALENARLFREASQRLSELETLQRSSMQLASSLDLETVLSSVLESAMSVIPASHTHIYLYDEAAEAFTYGTALWRDGRRDPAVPSPRPEGFTAAVAHEGRIIVINDAPNHPFYASTEAQGWGLQAIAGLPIRRAGRTLGVFTISFLEPHTFSEAELRVLSLLGDQAAVAVENARLFEAARRRAERERQVSEITTRVRASAEVDIILQTAIRELGRTLGASEGVIQLDTGDAGSQPEPEGGVA
jgi:GAF domain-containing protein/HAMP domain-containing protein